MDEYYDGGFEGPLALVAAVLVFLAIKGVIKRLPDPKGPLSKIQNPSPPPPHKVRLKPSDVPDLTPGARDPEVDLDLDDPKPPKLVPVTRWDRIKHIIKTGNDWPVSGQ